MPVIRGYRFPDDASPEEITEALASVEAGGGELGPIQYSGTPDDPRLPGQSMELGLLGSLLDPSGMIGPSNLAGITKVAPRVARQAPGTIRAITSRLRPQSSGPFSLDDVLQQTGRLAQEKALEPIKRGITDFTRKAAQKELKKVPLLGSILETLEEQGAKAADEVGEGVTKKATQAGGRAARKASKKAPGSPSSAAKPKATTSAPPKRPRPSQAMRGASGPELQRRAAAREAAVARLRPQEPELGQSLADEGLEELMQRSLDIESRMAAAGLTEAEKAFVRAQLRGSL